MLSFQLKAKKSNFIFNTLITYFIFIINSENKNIHDILSLLLAFVFLKLEPVFLPKMCGDDFDFEPGFAFDKIQPAWLKLQVRRTNTQNSITAFQIRQSTCELDIYLCGSFKCFKIAKLSLMPDQ